ncbi:hypothetical protein ACFRJ9_21615 [Paenarthrobacter sp. NPDC056912]|uniref:hypothetical protein n=1 Tax=Paenarthrobacter sp. NPDC056912 TaxID=3345965 RepID=UPI003672FDDA
MHPLALLPSVVERAMNIPLKLSDDDVFLSWTGIVIPAVAAVASVLVAAISVRIAARAKKIAEDSEAARREDQAHREVFERTLRFDAALKSLYLGIAGRIEALVEYNAVVRTVAFNLAQSGRPEITLSSRPPESSLLALIASARLDAGSDDEHEMLEVAASVVIMAAEEGQLEPKQDSPAAREARLGQERHRLEGLLYGIEEWRLSSPPQRVKLLEAMRPEI